MKHVLKTALVLLLAFLTLFGVVACNRLPEPDMEGNVEEGFEVDGTITLTYDASTKDLERAPNAMIQAFTQKYPKAKVNTDFSVGDINARISTGDIGDVFMTADMNVYTYAATNKALMPLDAYAAELEIDTTQIYNAIYQMGVVNGRLYMAARDFNQICLFYNKDAVTSKGLPLPKDGWSWEDFKQYAQTLTETSGETGEYTRVGAMIQMQYSPIYTAFLVGFGGGKWYNEQKKTVEFTGNEKVLQGVQEMVDVLQAGYVYSGKNFLPSAEDNKYAKITDTDYVFTQIVHPGIPKFGTMFDNKEIDWDIVSFPQLPVHSVGSGGIGFSVYNRSRNAGTAAAFALFIFTEEGQIAYNGEIGGSVPHIQSLAEQNFWKYPNDKNWSNKNFDAFVSFPDAAIVGQVYNLVPYSVAKIIDEGMASLLKSVLQGEGSVSDLLGQLESKATAEWKSLQEAA